MRSVVISVAVLLLLPGPARAASGYEKCLQEEQALRTQEKEKCSGLSYLLNPSGCFTAQKALKAFTAGACPGIIASSKPQQSSAPATPATAQVPVSSPVPPPAAAKEAVKGGEGACDRLREENARLKAEVERLRSEVEQLRKR